MHGTTILTGVVVACCLSLAGAGLVLTGRGQEQAGSNALQESMSSKRAAPIKIPATWEYTTPLITPEDRDTLRSISQKDPSVVFFQGKWHVFMTIKSYNGTHIEHVSFDKWENADKAPRSVIMLADTDYFAAPQVFYFAPQKKWYLIYQVGLPNKKNLQISFSTTENINDPDSWTRATSIFRSNDEDPRQQGGLDYWVICDQTRAYLFFTSLNGKLWRMWTRLEDFPYGFGHLEVALKADIFEASHTYKLKGLDNYLTIIEANPNSNRYYKAYLADKLEGVWTPIADTRKQPFASDANVHPASGVSAWADNISHGELIRAGYDQTMVIDPEKLRLVFQGALQKEKTGIGYGRIPWRVGILTPAGVSAPK